MKVDQTHLDVLVGEVYALADSLAIGFVLFAIFGGGSVIGKFGIVFAAFFYPAWILARFLYKAIVAAGRMLQGAASEGTRKGLGAVLAEMKTDLKESRLASWSFALSFCVLIVYFILSRISYLPFTTLFTIVTLSMGMGVSSIACGLRAFHKGGKPIAIISVLISAMIFILFNLRYSEYLFKE